MAGRKSNGEGTISVVTRNGKPYYKANITIGWDSEGKQIRKSFGSYKKSVVLDKMNTAKYQAKTNSLSNSDITFGKLFENWIFNFKKIDVSPNTFYEYEASYRLRIILYSIARKKANQITLNDLQKYFNELQENFTINTIKKTYIQIHSCIKFALIQGIMMKDFCPGVTLQKLVKKENVNVFSKEEQELVIKNLDIRNIVDALIYLTFYTGLRLGEVLGLQWSDINGNMISITRQYRRNVEVEKVNDRKLTYKFKELKTKNKELKTKNSAREIPLPDKVLKMLENLPKDHDLIFSDNGKPIEPKRPQRRITALCKKLNIPHRSFHSIRHSYATRLFELEIPIKTVQVLLGHSDIATTMDIYTHVMKEKKLEVLDKLNNL
ncbi:tyrosine-type recombinase/integrase [Fusobacterium watanabei]|uniref:tyrosine-type recombinase/integrase n=1 Tax=Fusobacterium watanabei TaxID=2686067 RepID=UPI003B5880A3